MRFGDFAAIGLSGLLVAACGDLPTEEVFEAPAPSLATISARSPFTAQAYNECTEEWVDFVGTAHRVSMVQDNGGAFVLKIKDDWKASGVGRTSGIKYQGSLTQFETFVLAAGWFDTRLVSIRFTAQGSVDDFVYSVLAHTTISPTGEITSSFEHPKISCR